MGGPLPIHRRRSERRLGGQPSVTVQPDPVPVTINRCNCVHGTHSEASRSELVAPRAASAGTESTATRTTTGPAPSFSSWSRTTRPYR